MEIFESNGYKKNNKHKKTLKNCKICKNTQNFDIKTILKLGYFNDDRRNKITNKKKCIKNFKIHT